MGGGGGGRFKEVGGRRPLSRRPTPPPTPHPTTRYCAGLLDGSVRAREELFDVLVDVTNREVVIADHSKDDFR